VPDRRRGLRHPERADIADDDLGAFFRHQKRDAAADASRRAGDNGDFA
jgi:hypothetical protein